MFNCNDMLQFAVQMKRLMIVFSAALLSYSVLCSEGAEARPAIREAARLPAAISPNNKGVPFELDGILSFSLKHSLRVFVIKDESGIAILHSNAQSVPAKLLPGDRIRASGIINWNDEINSHIAECKKITVIGHNANVEYETVSVPELLEGHHDNHLVQLTGIVRDAFIDEVDPSCAFLVLQNGRDTLYSYFIAQEPPHAWLSNLVGAEISLKGLCSSDITSPRYYIGRCILFSGRDSISVIHPAPSDPFDVPPLTFNREDHAAAISGMARRRASGRTIAVWHGDRILLRTPENCIVRIDLAERNPPPYGTSIEAVGNPETDLYRLNLSHAIWRTNAMPIEAEAPPQDITAQQIINDSKGKPAMQTRYHGKAIRLRGIVRSLPSPGYSDGRLALECDKHVVPVDASSCPSALEGVEIGCKLDVSGTCLIETENWRPNAPFPRIKGFSVIVRTREDVHILSRPPWWTTGRLMTVIGALLVVIGGIVIWNRSLNRLAERRGRELLREQIEHVKSDLKVEERTRLAVELHDSLAQNLTGVSMEIEAAKELKGNAPADMLSHLNFAARTLMSCRNELRNCLWDLRSQALEEKSMDKAIERTLLPYVNDSRIAVRFNVPRTRLSDNTAHMLLCIIRELVLNAIRHGNASNIRVSGVLDGGELKFSVRDNGSGFDPENSLGVLQGHFGLQGIRERVEQLGGTLHIGSAIGSGTRVAISIKVPHLQ